MDRRKFFKSAAAGAAALAAGAATCPARARENKQLPTEAVGLLFDSTLCVGCKACVAACKEANGMPPEFSTQEQLWDTPLDLSGKTLNVIKVYRDGEAKVKDAEAGGYAFVKKSCLHCVDPSCVSACPVSAMTKDPKTGVVSYDKDACIGCRYCVAACPFGVPRFTYDQAVPQISKCQLCRQRWKDGKYAACAEVCPTGATLYGTVADIKQEIARRKSLKPGTTAMFPRGKLGGPDQSYPNVVGRYVDHVYGEKELGGTQMMMLSGVPFEKLGYPQLPERSYAAESETLQRTLYGGLIAPLAFLGVLTYVAKRNVKPEEENNG
ncbi:MAG: hydrogenase 2 operon protein HybA [Pseudomonadota bacterium]